ncbi:Ig-like domain-containing protein [Cohnella suwonensis]|uniref:Ig-like domain-containing protein n=1 Tax=Cohnella suwonensis TaxID=696072 RepID=A0ABW0M1I8_9BACL
MRKAWLGLLALLLLIQLPVGANAASNLNTEQKYDFLRQKNIFTGFADGSAHLYDSMTREQLAVVLWRLLDLPTSTTALGYRDVLKTRWSYPQIGAVTRANLMSGTQANVFAPEMNVTVEQLAAVFIRSYGLKGNGSTPVIGKVSQWARGAVSLALDRGLIPQLNDYTMDASRGLLVEAAYTVYNDTHIQPLRVRSVDALSNQSVRVNLYERGDNINLQRFSLKDVYGNSRGIQQAIVSQDGLSVVLWTDRQIGSVTHWLYVDGNPYSYSSTPDDTTKPTIVSQPNRIAAKTYEITFSEPVDSNTATNSSNYSLNDGLRITSLQLSSDLRRVTFTTSDQANGRTYRLTVRNVKDLVGNVMDRKDDLTFVGNGDNSKPKVTEVRIDVTTAIISVKFSEKIDPTQAVQAYHYAFDKGLGITQATLGKDGVTVYLRTTQQQDAVVYTLTVSGIPDLAGNYMDNSGNWKIGAVANPITPVRVQEIKAINNNTIEATFDRPVTGSDASNARIVSLLDGDSNVSLTDWADYSALKPGTDRVIVMQFRTKSPDPALFLTGRTYTARLSGIVGLETEGNGDEAVFAGTVKDNLNPFAAQTYATDRRTVRVVFSEPVTNVKPEAFRIRERGGDWVNVTGIDNGDPNKIFTEISLKLGSDLKGGTVYELSFQGGIVTDAAKWNEMKTAEGGQPFILSFNA